MFNKVNKYIIIEFIKIFLLIYFSIFLLTFVIDYLDFITKAKAVTINNNFIVLLIILLKTPLLVEELTIFAILISVSLTLKKFISTNEMIIFLCNEYSSWKIIKILSYILIIFSFVNIFIINPFFILLNKKSKQIELFYTEKETNYFISSNNGLWFKFTSLNGQKNIIFRSSKIYLKELKFLDNIVIIFNENGVFEERLVIEEMIFNNGNFDLQKIFSNQKEKQTNIFEKQVLETNLTKDFILQQIQNKYENVNLMSIFKIVNLIKIFKKVNLNNHIFIVKLVIYILTPLIFIIMSLTAHLFINNFSRRNNFVLEFLLVIICGVLFFVIFYFIKELIYANKISVFYLINYILSIFLVLLILLIRKINL